MSPSGWLYATVRPPSEPQTKTLIKKGPLTPFPGESTKNPWNFTKSQWFCSDLATCISIKTHKIMSKISPSHLSGLVWSGLLGGSRSVTVKRQGWKGWSLIYSFHNRIATMNRCQCWSENCWDLYPQTWRYEIFTEGSKKNMFIGSRLNDLGKNITSQRGQRASN